MSEEKEPRAGEAAELRVVVDAQIALAMFLARRDDPVWVSPKRQPREPPAQGLIAEGGGF